jgi:glycosyltransferase involved in cell wall biosynthesis
MPEGMTLNTSTRTRARGGDTRGHDSSTPRRARFARGTVDLEVIIPVYNEEARIGETLTELVAYLERQRYSASLVVVDNGCADRTLDRIDEVASERIPIRVVACSRKGKGAAIRRAIMLSEARFVGFCDADLATPIDTIGPVMERLGEGHQVVIASRRCAGASYVTVQPLVRRLGGMVFRSMAGTVVAGIADTQCGFKFFEASVAKRLFSRSEADGFAFDVEILGLARRCGFDVTEVPVAWTAIEGSSLNPLVDGPKALRELLALRARLAAMPA